MSSVKRAFGVIERLEFFAGRGAADDNRGFAILAFCDEMIIKGVQWLADFQHDEIGHVHDVVDAADADFFQRRRSQSGLGPIFTPLTTRAV